MNLTTSSERGPHNPEVASDSTVVGGATGRTSLQIIVVGTGRSGTTALFDIVQQAFDVEGIGRTAGHEWNAVFLEDLYCQYLEAGDQKHLNAMKFILERCPHHCIAADPAWLPIVSECVGSDLTIIHLKREDRGRNISSLVENAERFPENHGYYVADKLDVGTRPTAWHYGAMTREAWNALPTWDRFAWHYDNIHATAEVTTKLFREVLYVETERIGEADTLGAIARAIGVPEIKNAPHLNRHLSIDGLSSDEALVAQRLTGKLDLKRASKDLNYGLRHFGTNYVQHLTEKVGGAASLDGSQRKAIDDEMRVGYEVLSGLAVELVQLRSLLGNLFDVPATELCPVAARNIDASSLRAEIATLIAQRDLARAQRDEESAQRDRLQREKDAMMQERDRAWTERDEQAAQRSRLERKLLTVARPRRRGAIRSTFKRIIGKA
jgi:hypothetical protein